MPVTLSCDAERIEINNLMEILGIKQIHPMANGFGPQMRFVYKEKEFICDSDELLSLLQGLHQEKIMRARETTKGNDFGWAIIQLKSGHKVYRAGWNGKGIHLELRTPDEFSKMTQPYIYINTMELQNENAKGLVPWLASQTDMLSEDWERKI